MEMDMEWKWSGNGAQFVKTVWIGLDLGQSEALKPCDRHRTFTKHDKSNHYVLRYNGFHKSHKFCVGTAKHCGAISEKVFSYEYTEKFEPGGIRTHAAGAAE